MFRLIEALREALLPRRWGGPGPGHRLPLPWTIIQTRLVRLGHLVPLIVQTVQTMQADPNANGIATFFSRLTADLTVFAVAMTIFFFSLSALLYMTSSVTTNERLRQHAISSLYGALVGLALVGLAGIFALLINNAATGAAAGQ